MKENKNNIADRFLKIMNQLLILEKTNILTLNNGVKLYPSEIHLILATETGQASSFNSLVKKLGITKGAVSQTISRLEKKGILEKRKEQNELDILFTPLGKEAITGCKKIRSELVKQLSLYIKNLADNEIETINRFFMHIEDRLDLAAHLKS